MTAEERAVYWEKSSWQHAQAEDYYRQQLVDAHALIGRLLHQMSERWDTANITQFFPTDNPHHKRTTHNPTGRKDQPNDR